MIAPLLLWQVDTQVRGHGDTTVGSTVAGVITLECPGPSGQVEDINVIKPNAVQILTTNDKKSISGNRGKMSIAGFGRGHEGVVLEGPRGGHPAFCRDIVETDIIQYTEVFRAVICLWLQTHAAEYDEILVPFGKLSRR